MKEPKNENDREKGNHEDGSDFTKTWFNKSSIPNMIIGELIKSDTMCKRSKKMVNLLPTLTQLQPLHDSFEK